MPLYLSGTAKCISKAMCMFGKPNGIVSYTYRYDICHAAYGCNIFEQYACLSRQDILENDPEYYITAGLYATRYGHCHEHTILNGHVCACSEDMYLYRYELDIDGYAYCS